MVNFTHITFKGRMNLRKFFSMQSVLIASVVLLLMSKMGFIEEFTFAFFFVVLFFIRGIIFRKFFKHIFSIIGVLWLISIVGLVDLEGGEIVYTVILILIAGLVFSIKLSERAEKGMTPEQKRLHRELERQVANQIINKNLNQARTEHDEYIERSNLEMQSAGLRTNNTPRHMVAEVDDKLGRNEHERDWQDKQNNYEQPKWDYPTNTSGKMQG